MRFSELATGLPMQTVEEVEKIKGSFPIILSVLHYCGLDKRKLEDETILEIVAFHWVNHFATRLEVQIWTSDEIALLFLKLLNDSFIDNFKERIELCSGSEDKMMERYHSGRVFPRECDIHRNLNSYLTLNEHLIPSYEISPSTNMLC